MRRFLFPLIAALGVVCAFSGIWFDGLRNEVQIGRALDRLPRLSETPFFRCADSFYWVSYAREMIETGKWRVRSTEMDNAPYGRPNYGWASLNAWYLVALGKAWSIVTGSPLRSALLSSAMWSGPILYLFALAGILASGSVIRNFPAAAVAVFVLGTAPRVYADFAYAVPGHHGWHDLFCFATLVFLAAGIRKTNSHPWFVGAGVAGAGAIWIGATQQAFGLAAAGLGALAAMLTFRFAARKGSISDLPPAECWRIFGITGGVSAIVFYLLEYAPGPWAMRLEVNHPIYAIGFLLGGEFLCRAQRLLFSTRERGRGDLVIALAIAAGLAGIAASVLLGPSEWHAMRQPFMQRLHHEIAEFQPISLSQGLLVLGAPMFLVGVAFSRAFVGDRAVRDRIALMVTACPCAMAIALSFVQVRWAGIAGACAAAVAATLFADLRNWVADNERPPPSSLRLRSFPLALSGCILVSLGLIGCWSVSRNREHDRQVRAEVIDRLATMEVASMLQGDATISHPIAMFSGQKERQAWINYVTGIRSVGSLYWDSPNGIRDEAEFLATYDDAAARRLARQRGIQYVVVSTDSANVIAYHCGKATKARRPCARRWPTD